MSGVGNRRSNFEVVFALEVDWRSNYAGGFENRAQSFKLARPRARLINSAAAAAIA